jgi:UMF1 family MFS transporter
VLLAPGCVVAANIAFEFAAVFNNAFLPDIAPRDRIGRLSGISWPATSVGCSPSWLRS